MPVSQICPQPGCCAAVPTHAAACPACGGSLSRSGSTASGGASASQPAPPTSSPKPPPRIGRFVLRKKLGAGAFGTVYLAHDPQLDREVALKVPNAGALDGPKRVERFLREAKAAAGLRHPHVVPVYDAGTADGRHYIAAAYIAGKPLSDAIEEAGTDLRRAARLAHELADALAYAHEQGVVHRDVKPANVLLDAADHAHLTDFGLAAREAEAKLTNDGAVLGTPAYMARSKRGGRGRRWGRRPTSTPAG